MIWRINELSRLVSITTKIITAANAFLLTKPTRLYKIKVIFQEEVHNYKFTLRNRFNSFNLLCLAIMYTFLEKILILYLLNLPADKWLS
jgi:hypothetical protein